MKKLKWTLGLLLCLVMTLAMMTGVVFAAETVDSGTCGDNITWTLDDEGTLTISGTGEMKTNPWRDNHRNDIKKAEIGAGVTNIRSDAFSSCINLESVTIPDSVTSIGASAFSGCNNLKNVDIPDSVTSMDQYAFNGCINLERVTISANLKNISKCAFYGCKSLESATIQDSVESIGDMAFSGCEKLKNVDIPYSVMSMDEYAFSGCKNLESVTISANLKNISIGAFSGCNSLESVTISDSVENIGDRAFSGCEKLKNVNIPDSVTSIGEYVFSGCSSLESITIPASVKSIGSMAFNKCYAFKSIVFAENTPPDIATMAFNEVTATVYYPANNEAWKDAINKGYGGELTWEASHLMHDRGELPGYDATCTKEGRTDGVICLTCHETVEGWEVIPTTGHKNIVVDKGVKATSTKTGLTAGSHCADCGKVIKKQTITLAKPVLTSGTKNIATRKIVVKWKKNSTCTGYQVKYITGSTTKTVKVRGKSTLSKTLKSLKKGKTYKVYVRCYKTVGSKTYYSPYSTYKKVKVRK